MSVKERLRLKLKEKKESKQQSEIHVVENPAQNPFEEDKIPKPGPIYFEFVMRKRVHYDMQWFQRAYLVTEMRRHQAVESIDKRVKTLFETPEKLVHFIKNIVFNISETLIDMFYDALPLLEKCPNPYYYSLFEDAKVFVHINHTIVIIDRPASPSQIDIEYIGLMWAARMATFDDGRDIIVSRSGFRAFCAMMIGLEMFDIFKKHPLVKEHQLLFSYANLTVMVKEFGCLTVPSDKKIDKMLNYVRCVPWWQYY